MAGSFSSVITVIASFEMFLSSMLLSFLVMSMRLLSWECGTTTTGIHSSERWKKLSLKLVLLRKKWRTVDNPRKTPQEIGL